MRNSSSMPGCRARSSATCSGAGERSGGMVGLLVGDGGGVDGDLVAAQVLGAGEALVEPGPAGHGAGVLAVPGHRLLADVHPQLLAAGGPAADLLHPVEVGDHE